MTAAEAHALIDVIAGCEARLIQPDRVREKGDEQEVDDEAAAVLGNDDSPRARVSSSVSSLVAMLRTTSMSFITGAGLKKCVPITRSGRRVARAISMIGSADVLVARMASGPTMSSSRAKSETFAGSCSTIASTQKSHSAKSSRRGVNVSRSLMRSTSSSLSFPVLRPRSSDAPTRRCPAAS
jgi:hypothetical protein